jgi:exosortase C (VPDSG-CTERM-specific)
MTVPAPENASPASAELRRRLTRLALITGVLVAAFGIFLLQLVRFAWPSELYSHIVLVPVISAYLVWVQRRNFPENPGAGRSLAIPFAIAGALFLAVYGVGRTSHWFTGEEDGLCVITLSFLFFFWAGAAVALGKGGFRSLLFPLAFLAFIVPLPAAWEDGIEHFLQHASADVAYFFIHLAGTPIFREGTVFTLPGITLQVAPECSGIHSSLVLLMIGLIAGHFFLRRPWAKGVLAASVIVLGILRNGARIFTLAELCVHVDPEIIHSPIHKHGGPPFFALSLIPFFILIWFLRKMESRRAGAADRPL